MTRRIKHWRVLVVGTALLAGGIAIAADTGQGPAAAPSPEQRHEMAEIHQKMADCLMSERPFTDCKAEMQKSCAGMGKEGCSMMGSMGMMHGGSHEKSSK